jgi:2-amino-4-hydroxy-6-hydroxymethyldihydropteridine diphosphokinase
VTEGVFVALGSNLGERERHLDEALRRMSQLSFTEVLAVAPIIETDAMLPDENPTPQPKFLNTVAKLRTVLEPMALLTALKTIEQAMGRRSATRWAARIIDLDLLLYGGTVISLPTLTVPHPGLVSRVFVLRPLLALEPALIHPGTGENLSECLSRLVRA